LLDFVNHVIEADSAVGNVIHPLPSEGGEDGEREITRAAAAAAKALLTPGQLDWANEHGMQLLPARRHIADIQVVGLPRLKYRARTSATAAWLANAEEWKTWTNQYLALAGLHPSENPVLATSMGHQGRDQG
jgi:hypothetical protein